MADIIKHQTRIYGTYAYIDEVKSVKSKWDFTGWICSTEHEIEDILIEGVSLNPTFSPRNDVVSVYNPIGFNHGLKVSIKKTDIKKPIQIKFKGADSLIEMESFSKWIAYYSGFANVDKGVIVVDNFYANPDFIREWAMNEINFSPSDYHKGERATERFSIFGMKEKLEEIIGKPVYNWNYDAYANGIFQFCTADQPIVYHVDNQTYAGIVFLTPDAPPSTGTAFYRSKVTGDYKFDDEKRQTINYVRAFQGKSAEMNFYDGTNFEKIDEVGNVYNRLVLFDAKNIHAATQYFGDGIDNARFFHMFFFDV
jgi:hypothetical protein